MTVPDSVNANNTASQMYRATIFSQLEAAASISFLFVKLRLQFECGLYSRVALFIFSVIAVHSLTHYIAFEFA